MTEVIEDRVLLKAGGGKIAWLHVRRFLPASTPRGTVFCLHSFAGNGREFDFLAAFLADSGYAVVCPDMLGRGKSSWLGDASAYGFQTHMRALSELDRYATVRTAFVGTGWGGVAATFFVSGVQRKIDRLILNNTPLGDGAKLERSGAAILDDSRQDFAGLAEARAYFARTRPFFASLPERAALSMLEHNLIEREGRYSFAMDPACVAELSGSMGRPYDLRPLLGQIKSDVLVLHGAEDEDLPFARNVHTVPEPAPGNGGSLTGLAGALTVLGFLELGPREN
jgi:pimeloyl-ACP methyl ester carboxylesterase